jgi:hypothetical protein
MAEKELKELYDVKIKQLNTAIDNITTVLSTLSKTQKEHSYNILVLTDSVNTKAKYLDNKIFINDTKLISLEKKVAAYNTNMSSMNKNTNEVVDSRVGALEKQLADLQADYATLQSAFMKMREDQQLKDLEQMEVQSNALKAQQLKQESKKWYLCWT